MGMWLELGGIKKQEKGIGRTQVIEVISNIYWSKVKLVFPPPPHQDKLGAVLWYTMAPGGRNKELVDANLNYVMRSAKK